MIDNNKSKSIGLFLLVIAIIVLAISAFRLFNKAVPVPTLDKPNISTSSQEHNFLNYEEKNVCVGSSSDQTACRDKLLEAINIDDEGACDGLSSEDERATCRKSKFILLAARSDDLAKCDEFIQEVDRKSCKAQVAFSLAVKKQDIKYCDYIENKDDFAVCQALFDKKNATASSTSQKTLNNQDKTDKIEKPKDGGAND